VETWHSFITAAARPLLSLVRVGKEAYPDAPDDSTPWVKVDVEFVSRLDNPITLESLKTYKTTDLSDMVLLHRARLSVQPVTAQEWTFIENLA